MLSRTSSNTDNSTELLEREHQSRELQRTKTKLPILLLSALFIALGVGGGVYFINNHQMALGVTIIIVGVFLALCCINTFGLLADWDRAVILRLGRFQRVTGPGIFKKIPVIDSVMRIVDMRIRTTSFYSEAILTKDTVAVAVDAIAFWHVWDAQKAVLEVENYYCAISLAIQTALRDAVGVHTLTELLKGREEVANQIESVISKKTEDWGITVTSIEIRDIVIPNNLKDALSKQAQAEREKQARTTLGQAERDIAETFVEAGKIYDKNPTALQLRAMNIVFEGLRAGGSLMVVPSSAVDSMNLGGLTGLASIKQTQQTKQDDIKKSKKENQEDE